jgi:glycine cleavage system H protein
MNIPRELRYSESHEWIRIEGKTAYVGISDYAQESLGDIVYVEIPETGGGVDRGDEIATIESVKAASAIYAPLSGIIKEVNSELEETPELINKKPYNTFIFAIEMSDPSEVEELWDAAAYEEFLEAEAENQ